MADISLLKIERGRIKGSLTKLRNYVKEIPENISVEDIETRLEKLEELQRAFAIVDDKLGLNDIQSENEEFDDKYLEIKAILRRHLNQLQRETTAAKPNSDELSTTIHKIAEQQKAFLDGFNNQSTHLSQIKLPKVDVPPFSGDYKDWPSFKDLFVSSIHNNKDLSDVHKLQYLKGLLKGEAASIIKHLTITESSYCEAWVKLMKRYDKKKQIVSAYISAFITQPSVSQPSATSLRRLVDTTDQLIRGINVLGREASVRDPWLIYLILNKTDSDTRKAWAEETANKDFPSFDSFLEFLSTRCDALESCDPAIKRSSHNQPIRNLHLDTTTRCCKCSQAHSLFKCPEYKKMDIATKRTFVGKNSLCFNCLNSGHPAQRCTSKFRCHYCKKLHHSSLHQNKPAESATTNVDMQPVSNFHLTSQNNNHQPNHTRVNAMAGSFNPITSNKPSTSYLNSYTVVKEKRSQLTLLPTALLHVADAGGALQLCRILLDSGSQASFISEDCVQRLGLQRNKAKLIVRGLSSTTAAVTKGMVTVSITSRFSSNFLLSAQLYILNRLTAPQPSKSFSCIELTELNKYDLADPYFNESSQIDMILGADYFIDILKDGRATVSQNLPSLQNTAFGYIVTGPVKLPEDQFHLIALHTDISNIDASLRKFWEIEELPNAITSYTIEEEQCEAFFASTHEVDPITNRYLVKLPFKNSPPSLGESLNVATSRFKSIERKFWQNKQLHSEYSKFMTEYANLGHLEVIPQNILKTQTQHLYLPHHAVFKPSSTTSKIRVVFDGSSLTSNGISLNQMLLVGPKVQRDLLPILLSFRTFRIAVVADIEKMYRQVLVHKDHRNFQRIVWRSQPDDAIQHLWLTTVTYGTSAAPFLATRCLKQLTIDFKGQFPLAETAINENFYVDDLMGGASDEAEATELYKQLTTLLNKRGFSLHKWASNSGEFLKSIPTNACDETSKQIMEHPESIKVLGLKWMSSEDYFTFDSIPQSSSRPTKRIILSESSKIFDPLGFISPVTIIFKILLQKLWLLHYDWDDICEPISEKWNKLRSDLFYLQQLRIPRWLHSNTKHIELHGFSDASESAYAAVVYIRSADEHENIFINIVAAKTRVSPIKQLSIPKLELCGATLLANLVTFVRSTISIADHQCFAWTDSTVVLTWLSSHPRKWKCFIGNRTSAILSILPRQQWNHVSSDENPADLASRGIYAQELINSSIWWQGPTWLKSDWKKRKINPSIAATDAVANQEKREQYLEAFFNQIVNDSVSPLFNKFSSLKKILRILGKCFQFVRNSRIKSTNNRTSWIKAEDIQRALRSCIMWAQSEAFENVIKNLQSKQPIQSSSQLFPLCPFLDSDKILRVGGRLENSNLSFNSRHPIILPKNHIVTKYLIAYLHENHLHAGTSHLLGIIRQNYWILSCRTSVKAHINKCITCVRHRATTAQQLMANLPKHRVGHYKAFQNVGVDYAGPFTILLRRGRGARTTKGYLALFVCFSTRAIHLELAGDLTSETFIACLRRFTARRGIPATIYSDNGTNFVGAKRQLEEIRKLVTSIHDNSQFSNFLSFNNITWCFNPPAAPHFGGIWEAGVRSVKQILRRTIGETKLTYEEMSTLLTQIEGLLNSRPLTPMMDDISSLDSLTPAHFLIGEPITCLPDIPVNQSSLSLQGRWRLLQNMHQHFWKRWQTEYLSTLQQRPKWQKFEPNLSVGDMVVIKEPNLPPSRWILGRVVDTHPGPDNLVRVLTVRTANGIIKRPAVKLCKLPVSVNN